MGKAWAHFEEVSQLKPGPQQHIVRVVEDLLAAQRLQRPKAA
jgi:hypothetical protein